jgi:hypothetical protein
MSIQPPKIDNRTYEDIVAQTVKLVQHYTAQKSSELVDNQAEFLLDRTLAQDIKDTEGKIIATAGTLIDEKLADAIAKVNDLKQINVKVKGWYKQTIDSDPNNPKSKIQNPKSNDVGLALIRIFGRMAATVSDRLNRVPEKNFLAFLDLLGTQILPPQPARVPLTFYLASGVPENTTALVPAYTQISAPPAEEEVVFETEHDLIVTLVQLQAVFVRQLEADRYSDRTSQATGKEDTAFLVFAGDTPIEHSLYLACEPVFSLSEVKTVTLNIYSSQVTDLANLPLTWSYWNGITWKKLEKENKTESDRLQVTLKDLPAFPPQTVNQISARWLKVELDSRSSLSVERITASVDITDSQLKLDQCFFNTVPLDMNKDFYPFGEQPRFNDTFYLASQEIFSKPGFTVKLNVTISSDKVIDKNGGVEIAWEFYNGLRWQKIGESNITNPAIDSQQKFSDLTQFFTQSGKVTLTIPDKIQPVTINGINNYWLRARIVKGNYGTEATYRQRIDDKGNPVYVDVDKKVPVYELVPATFAPPSIQFILLEYSLTNVSISDCVSYNNFTYQVCDQNFHPFVAATDRDTNPTLYLGFDRPFPNRAIALYFQVETPTATELSAATTNAAKPRLVWEYSNGKDWTKLNAIDRTAAFADRGLIQFIGPSDFTATQEFNQTLYWLRVRRESGEFRVLPRLRRILTNTIWASQTTTLHNEILGGSNGNPNQTFRTVQSPILPGQQLEVQEQKILPPEEQQKIEKLEGKDAITIVRDEKGEIETLWVRWHEVADFYQSGTRDRHYKINRLTGEIQFGDGQYGLIPPQGRNNIRMTRYQTDGGAKGNKFTNTINQLKTTIPYIDRVTNLEAAGGGSDRESIDRVKERGQKFIRHRNRAVTVQDFEDLAYEASPDIARVKAIAPICEPLNEDLWLEPKNPNFNLPNHQKLIQDKKTKPGLVKLFIVPGNDSPQPIPSLALIDRVENYLRDRASPTLNLWVGSPKWLEVSVTAEVVPTSLEFADAVRNAVIQRLETFLHPLTGGVSGQGWEFGREPHLSDFYALIEAIDRVDYVRSLSVKIDPEAPEPPEPFLIFSGSHDISLFLSDIGG